MCGVMYLVLCRRVQVPKASSSVVPNSVAMEETAGCKANRSSPQTFSAKVINIIQSYSTEYAYDTCRMRSSAGAWITEYTLSA